MDRLGWRWLAALACLLSAIGIASPTTNAATIGVVVGSEGVNVRSCPRLDCDVLDVLPLGSSVEIAGDEVDGFVPVRHRSLSGYAYRLYVATDPAEPPYLGEGQPGCNRISLIFNIGIGEEPAWSIVDTLVDEDVPATMFIMGWWAEAHPEALTRLAAGGFVIGSHGDQPVELTRRPDAAVLADIRDSASAIEDVLGAQPGPWFTPYAAAIDGRVRSLIAREGYLPISWTVPAIDYGENATAEGVYQQVIGNVYDGAIVELHLDGPASTTSTAVALPRIVADLRDQGYQLVDIPDMAAPCR
ncbi:MAG: polysaccharide deacetylase family protein [Thermomicrobiales bacterium]